MPGRWVNPLTAKLLTIGLLTLVLLLPLAQVRSLVSERQGMRLIAVNTVGAGWGRSQVLGPPLLEIPVETATTVGTRTVRTSGLVHVLPEKVALEASLEPAQRRVGIYEVPVFVAGIVMAGRFDPRPAADLLGDAAGRTVQWSQARIVVLVSDVRGIREVKLARANGVDLHLQPAAYDSSPGIGARLDASALAQDRPIDFRLELSLAGSETFQVLPLGRTTTARLTSSWRHPNFAAGAFLPVRHTIDSQGFDSHWQVLELNRGFPQSWPEARIDSQRLHAAAFGVSLYQPVDTYQRNERAIKYALLFIAITLMSIFLWEQLSGMRLHAVQYLLVGLALCVFYLLLLALSEHIAFGLAYLIAAAALATLIAAYLAGALHSRRVAAFAAGAIAAVYGLLYLLVLSEQYALLLGSVLVFSVLAVIMLVTRRLDWHAVGESMKGARDT